MQLTGLDDKQVMVGETGFEPVTLAVSRQCSTAELHTLIYLIYIKYTLKM